MYNFFQQESHNTHTQYVLMQTGMSVKVQTAVKFQI